MDKIPYNSHASALQAHEQVTSGVLSNYQNTIENYENAIRGMKQKIGQRVALETIRIPMLENMVKTSLKEILVHGNTFKPDYAAFGKLRDYNDEQIYQLQHNCPDIQSLLEYYQQKDKEQLDTIIRKLQDIVDGYQTIVDYCMHMVKNAHNRNNPTSANFAQYGLDVFSKNILSGINTTGEQVIILMHNYNKRVSLEPTYRKIQTFDSLDNPLSN